MTAGVITGQPVIRARKIRDFKDPVLRKRLNLSPAPRVVDLTASIPACPTCGGRASGPA